MSKARELAELGAVYDSGALSNRNLIINGAMQVAQRGTSHATATSYTLDRWNISQTTDGAVTITQDSSVPSGSGLANSYKLDVTTADTSIGAAQRVFPHQIIEAQNLQHLQYGTSEAKSITLSFYVKSNLTGTYTVLFYNSDASRHQSATYTIDSANTWEQKKITIQGDTTSGFNDDNGAGLEISWWLAAGSNFTSGTLGTGSWQNETAANKVSSSNVNIMSSTSNEWFLTGCQLEVGSEATPFEHRSFGDELARCQRYYYRRTGDPDANYIPLATAYLTTAIFAAELHPVQMRANPSVTISGNIRAIDGNTSSKISSSHSITSLSRVDTVVWYTTRYLFFKPYSIQAIALLTEKQVLVIWRLVQSYDYYISTISKKQR